MEFGVCLSIHFQGLLYIAMKLLELKRVQTVAPTRPQQLGYTAPTGAGLKAQSVGKNLGMKQVFSSPLLVRKVQRWMVPGF